MHFGSYEVAVITGTAFDDLNGNGGLDGGEPGLDGVTITVDTDGGPPPEFTQVTAGGGLYTFQIDGSGAFFVRQIAPGGRTETTSEPQLVILGAGDQESDVNFGSFDQISISGQTFDDLDGDGVEDPGEPGLDDVTIQLDTGANGTVDATTTTAGGGLYSFANLGPGTYRVRQVVPVGRTQTTANPADVVAVSGTDVSGVDFGSTTPGITGQAFDDLDGDGVKDPGEPGLDGVTIQLDTGANGSVDATTTTAGGGLYSFTGLGPGTYRVRQVVPAGRNQTTTNPADVAVPPSASGVDFGSFALISIGGQAFDDLDGDGVEDPGEPGLDGVTIQLDTGANGSVDATATTAGGGLYSFTGLGPGTYRVRQVVPAGRTQTTANPADVVAASATDVSGVDFGSFAGAAISGQAFDDLDGDGYKDPRRARPRRRHHPARPGGRWLGGANHVHQRQRQLFVRRPRPGTYRIRQVTPAGRTQTTTNPADVAAPPGATGVDFGSFDPVTISGQAFDDLDGDGVKDPGEPGLDGVTIQLDTGANGSVDATATSAGGGLYSFSGLGPGTYRVRQVVPTGRTQTTANPADVAASSGADAAGVDFGSFVGAAISGQAFDDLDGDGAQDAGETGLSGVTIQLDLGANGSIDQTTTTSGSGGYSFPGLSPGTYRVRQVVPAGRTQTSANPADVVVPPGASGVDFGSRASSTSPPSTGSSPPPSPQGTTKVEPGGQAGQAHTRAAATAGAHQHRQSRRVPHRGARRRHRANAGREAPAGDDRPDPRREVGRPGGLHERKRGYVLSGHSGW